MSIPEVISSALLMGAVGSLHCVGMCGPLAMALPVAHRTQSARVAGGALYNLGRITSYAALGLALGLIGETVLSGSVQRPLSIALGSAVLLYLLLPPKWKAKPSVTSVAGKPLMHLRQVLSRLFHSPKYASVYFIGLLNGLLPCGLIYLALSSSFLAGSALKGSLFMACLGLGTFPAMLAVVFFGNYMNAQVRLRLRKAVPVFLFLMGALLILRGMNLGIPFVSPMLPDVAKAGAVGCH